MDATAVDVRGVRYFGNLGPATKWTHAVENSRLGNEALTQVFNTIFQPA